MKTRGIGDQVTYKAKDHTVVGGFDWRQDKVVNMGGVKLTKHLTSSKMNGNLLLNGL